MNSKQLLIKCITLLYREHQRTDNTDHSSDLVKDALETITLPEVAIENDRSHHIISGLRQLIETMCDIPPNETYDVVDIKQQLRVIVEDDISLYDAFAEVVDEKDVTPELLTKSSSRLRRDVKNYLRDHEIRRVLRDYGKEAFKTNGNTNWRQKAISLVADLETYTTSDGDFHDPNTVDQVDFGNIDDIARIFTQAKEEESSDGTLRIGWQGLARMCGRERMGLRRGEFLTWGGLQHKFKSGFGLCILAQIAVLNHGQEHLINKSKKPLILHFTAENELTQNLSTIYEYLKENETGQKVDLQKVDPVEAAEYVQRRFKENGWDFRPIRIDPSEFTYRDYIEHVEYLEGRGYEIVFCLFDYLNMISKRGCTLSSGTGSDIRDLYRRMRNYNSKKKITFGTPHQLSTEAKNLLREGRDNFVQEIAEKGYWDGCKTIDNELDLELYVHLVEMYGKKFLAIQRGKHRKRAQTHEVDKYCVYEFQEVGTIPMDINGPDMSKRSFKANPQGEGGGNAWWAED